MGNLSRHADAVARVPDKAEIAIVPWLDAETAALLQATIASVACQHLALRAAVLYGSVARHDERPLTDHQPSDVDLLLVFERRQAQPVDFTVAQMTAIFGSVNEALMCYPHAPREVQVMLATEDLADWDETFVRNVQRDGVLLWARSELHGPLAVLLQASAT